MEIKIVSHLLTKLKHLKKMMIWKRKANSSCVEMFPLVKKGHVNYLIPLIVDHLTTLESNLSYYFLYINTE